MNFRVNPIFDHFAVFKFRVKIIFKVLFFWSGDMQLLSRRNDGHHSSRLVITMTQRRRYKHNVWSPINWRGGGGD